MLGRLGVMCALLTWEVLCSAAHAQLAKADESRESYRTFAMQNDGDARRGETLFTQDQKLVCTNCHRIVGAEKSGPNLDGIADKYSRAELIKHILEPSAAIKPGYELATLVTQSGRVFEGRIIRTTKEIFRLIDSEGRSRDVPRTEVEEFRSSTKSMMPDNLLASASRQDFADLIAYLETMHAQTGSGLTSADGDVEIPRLAVPINFRAVNKLKFDNPVWCGAVPGLPGRLAVVEHQEARIWLISCEDGGSRQLFLELSDQVKYGNNWGLMCLAFHPQFATNHRYFLEHEVEDGGRVDTIVVERTAQADLQADSGQPSKKLIGVEQPAFNHNGGCIAFGTDGMLYVAFGDGGPQRDPNGYCQDRSILHGSLLRLDVDRAGEDGAAYAIPADNPFLDAAARDAGVRPETWAYGFREPWRFSFDAQTGDLWLGDVGQDKFEEVCLVRRGENHGWNVFEAFDLFSDEYKRADEQYTPPVFAYHHRIGVSVTGGHVYRGKRSPSFDGVYVFGDYETRRIWGLRLEDGQVSAIRELGESPEHVASFGVGPQGEIYLVGYEGTVFQLDLSGTRFE